jgi:hypothetical protein
VEIGEEVKYQDDLVIKGRHLQFLDVIQPGGSVASWKIIIRGF